jgi:hypothetical protein
MAELCENAVRDLDFDWGARNPVPLAPNAKTPTRAETRAAIDAELAADPSRSDRAIAKAVGCDHKTVSTRRGDVEISPPGDSNSPLPQALPQAIEAQPDSESPSPPVTDRLDDAEEFDWNDESSIVLRAQAETAIYRNPVGDLVIRQRNWPDEDSFVVIAANCEAQFIDQLTDMMGIPTLGGPPSRTTAPTRR